MAFDKAYRTPSALTGIARGALQGVYESSMVSRYLPLSENQRLDFNFTTNSTTLPRAASYRSFNTEADQTVFEGGQSAQGKLPPISRRYNVDEYSHIQMIGGDLGAEFERKAEAIAAQVAVRLIQGAADSIETGRLEINERGLRFELDYGRRSELTATAATAWTDPDADVIGDLEALRDAFGSTPGGVLIPETVQRHLSFNKGIIEFAVGRADNLPSRVSYTDVLSVLGSFGFSNFFTNREEFIDQNGSARTLFSQDKVIFLPGEQNALGTALGSGPLGTTDIGVAAESLNPENGIGGTPGVFAGALASHNPEGFDVLVSAIGLPILQNADRTAVMTVL